MFFPSDALFLTKVRLKVIYQNKCLEITQRAHFVKKLSKNKVLRNLPFSSIFQSSFEMFEIMLIAKRNKHLIAYAKKGTRNDKQGKEGISEKTLVGVRSEHWCEKERER